jgi:hypothetical protein
VDVDLRLLPALLVSGRLGAVLKGVFSGKSITVATDVLRALEEENVGGSRSRTLSAVEAKLCAAIQECPAARARPGPLTVKWTNVPVQYARDIATGLDLSLLAGSACLALAQLCLWASSAHHDAGVLPPKLLAFKPLAACVGSNNVLAALVDRRGWVRRPGAVPCFLCLCCGTGGCSTPGGSQAPRSGRVCCGTDAGAHQPVFLTVFRCPLEGYNGGQFASECR